MEVTNLGSFLPDREKCPQDNEGVNRPAQPPISHFTVLRNSLGIILMLITTLIFTTGCDDPVYTPKPKGYFRIDLPEKEYTEFTAPECPYKFSIPTYATVQLDTAFFGERPDDPCWLDINMPELAGEIHLSYKEIGPDNTLEKLIEDAHKLAYKHTIKADYIDEALINKPGAHVSGILYQIGGNAASNIQFYVTDSTEHFLRGSLYFGVTPNEDSLAPVISFVRQDLLYMIETLEWAEYQPEGE